MKFQWKPRYISYICIALIAIIGGCLLYLKLRRFRHDVEDDIESSTETTTEDNMEKPGLIYDTDARGYRNNNPLNIRVSSNNWKGEIKPSGDGSFCQFKSMAYGFRAAMCCIRTYITKYHLTTLQEIINRWAPWGDGNNPTNYAKNVMKSFPTTFPSADTVISYNNQDQMTKLVYAMAIIENGSAPDMSDCTLAYTLM